ncbi:MAG: family 1 glycosylhydrolase [Candidatus Babeliales bacterium]
MKKCVCLFGFLVATTALFTREIQWDWTKIKETHISFPEHFLWGCSDSATQTEGAETVGGRLVENSWTDFEKEKNIQDRVGRGCQRWVRYESDFDLLAAIGMNTDRFSIEWCKYEEQEGQFNEAVLDHYEQVVDALLRRNITPFITLFHHTLPRWFLAKGGFESEENIQYFKRFALKVFDRLHAKVPYWIILNEPAAYALAGYFRGNYPPCKKNFRLTGTVIWHQLSAHVQIATEFKLRDPQVKVGITHMCQPIDAYSSYNPIEKMATKFLSYLVNETTIQFFKTGKFRWTNRPWAIGKDLRAPQTLDFIGINYYTHTVIKQTGLFSMSAKARPEDRLICMHDNEERIKILYPEGLYRSIVRAAKLGIPIFITENGAPTDDVTLKTEYLKKHLYVISRAIAEGYDVRGYFYWTLTDCYAWTHGFENKHGIYAVDFKTQERTLRPAVDYLLQVIREHKKRWRFMRTIE